MLSSSVKLYLHAGEASISCLSPSLSQPVTNSLVYVAAWKHLPEKQPAPGGSGQHYLLGLHGINYCGLLRLLVDEEVHVVVCEGREELHLHVGLCDRLRLPLLVLCVQEESSQPHGTWGAKNSRISG